MKPRLGFALVTIAIALAPSAAHSNDVPEDDAAVAAHESVERGVDDGLTFRARLAVPFVSAELINDNHGTEVLLGGSVGLDIDEALTLEAGGSWLNVDPGGFDIFGRIGWFWELADTRWDHDRSGWQHGVTTALGYRFLRDADEADGNEGSTDIHAATASAGWRSTRFWDGIGLEFRVLPTLSIGLAEESDGMWGETPMSTNPILRPSPIGNPEDFAWGLDLELTVGVAF